MFKVNDFKSIFFDRQRVISATDRATRRVLSKFGAFVRTSARSSIRRRKKISNPGQAPTNRTGLLKGKIFFGYDESKRDVVIGPALLNGSSEYGATTVPQLLEEGGVVNHRGRRGKRKRMRYRARPFMGPAMEKELPKLPDMWRNSVR